MGLLTYGTKVGFLLKVQGILRIYFRSDDIVKSHDTRNIVVLKWQCTHFTYFGLGEFSAKFFKSGMYHNHNHSCGHRHHHCRSRSTCSKLIGQKSS